MGDIVWFNELSKESIGIAGGKGANLGEMYMAKLPVPPGFVVTAQAYKRFIETTKIDKKIYDILTHLNEEETVKLEQASKIIQEIILETSMPQDIKNKIIEAYERLNIDTDVLKLSSKIDLLKQNTNTSFVAVRSSATAEDLPNASFAGQQATLVNIKGSSNLIDAVKQCWASLFTARAIYYRVKNKFPHEKVLIAVIVQKMVNSEKSGVMFSINPSTNNESEIVIEAGYGLGEAIVSGAINPDNYIIDKNSLEIKNKIIKDQEWQYVRDDILGRTVKKNLLKEKIGKQILTDKEIIGLAELAKIIEEHYMEPQDIEWAIESGKLYIVQSRPVTTLHKTEEKPKEVIQEGEAVLVEGLAASPGVAYGPVKIINDLSELSRVQTGDVLVTIMTNPDMVVAMQKAVAIVTDKGGTTSHAAIVSREMMIPCVVGTKNATTALKEGEIVTVDGTNGRVYKGEIKEVTPKEEIKDAVQEEIETVTEIKVIMDLPDFAEKVAKLDVSGVGLLRLEMMIAENGVHPVKYIKDGKKEEYIAMLVKGISVIAKAFKGKPVWVRTSDIRSDEYRNIKGGDEEPIENNPMMGWHGIRRGLAQKEILKAEFEAIKRVHDIGFNNVGVMIPMVTHIEQVIESRKLLEEIGLIPQENIDFGVMVETPAAVQIIEDICKVGVDFISFGTNDLTQFTLAIDRNNENVQYLYDEMHPAVLKELKYVIKICQGYNVETSICGQAGSRVEMAEFLVKTGIDSLSVNPDSIAKIRHLVSKIEKELLLKAARKDLNF